MILIYSYENIRNKRTQPHVCVTLLDGIDILFNGHSERYSGIKNDPLLNQEIISDTKRYGKWDKVVWFERPWVKKSRQLYAGQYSEVFSRKNLPSNYVKQFGIDKIDYYVDHHKSHAAASYYSSPYDEACIITIDAIGEWETLTIWYAWGSHFEKRYSMSYPNSIGLWYSAITQRLDLKPQEDEYILMGMAAWGNPNKELQDELRELLSINLHRGCLGWDSKVYPDDGTEQWKFDIAHNTQVVCEEEIGKIFKKASELVPETDNYCYGGGVALNCVANSIMVQEYPNLWILPNPNDGGSSLESAYVLGEHINFDNCFLGYDIRESIQSNLC